MKRRIIATVVLLAIGIVLCSVGAVICGVGDGFAFSKTLEYTEYTYEAESGINDINFKLTGNYNFIIQRGESCSLKYSQSEISTISVVESNGTLKVQEHTQWRNVIQSWFLKPQKTDLVLTVTDDVVLTIDCEFSGAVTAELPAWEYGNINFVLGGTAELKTAGEIKAGDIDFNIAGSAVLNLSGEFNNVDIDTSGSSIINVQGSATSLKLGASGGAKFKSGNLQCNDVSIKASGGVEADIKGVGENLTLSASGGCYVSAGEFTLSKAELHVSGGARVTVNASDYIFATISGAAKVNYYGDPQIEKHVSGSAQFNKIS